MTEPCSMTLTCVEEVGSNPPGIDRPVIEDVSMNGPRDWSKIAPQSGTTFLLQQRSAPQDEKRQTLGVYGLKTDSWIGASWSGRLLRGGCYACCPLKECLEWLDYDSHRRRQTVAG
ncbi:hypothetical protein M5K25_019793 [Dendrobium thyrsiflorum]|uniref:Uncharacterized protein n=1 Tax=Dendrobium thyrsiflorum TaxID=117978 RepID=A0ABD0UN42_DENTH